LPPEAQRIGKSQNREVRFRLFELCFASRQALVGAVEQITTEGKFHQHRRAALIMCVMESGQQYIKEWLSEDGLQFVFKSYG